MNLRPGDTFLYPLNCGETPHPYVILTPMLAGETVVVSIATLRPKSDPIVVLEPGEHPFLSVRSVPGYIFARLWTGAEIDQHLAGGRAQLRERMPEKLVQRMRNGLVDSDRTPNGVRQYTKEFL